MVFLGGLIQQIGTALGVGGFVLYLGTVVCRMARIFGVQMLQREVFLIGFYARAAAMVGIMGAMTVGIIEGTIPWPWLIAVFVLGAPSLALLVVRPVREDALTFELPRRGKSQPGRGGCERALDSPIGTLISHLTHRGTEP